jgi:CheY-like chemotaxis protein
VNEKPRVLIVDDSWSMRQTLRLLLSADFECLLSESALQALAHARQSAPDIILADVNMEGMDGYELRRQVRAEPALRQVPFLFLSGMPPRVSELSDEDVYLLKPVPPDQLLSQLHALLTPARPRARQAIS